jgi:pilus assembly protein CpaC
LLPADAAQAERVIQIGAEKRTATVSVYIGKSEDVRTDTSFVEITVGDPEVADVHPLTDRSLSILGKKNGTTRVSIYAEGKKLIGVFDVEVVYDTSLLQSEISRRFPEAKITARGVNGRIMLTGTSPDGPTLDRVVTIAKQFGSDVINTVQVLQPQQVMLEVRFIEVRREATRDLGMQWNIFGNRVLANIGANQPASRLPVSTVGPNVSPTALTVSPVVSAGVLSGGNPFGFLLGRMLANGIEVDVLLNALEEKGVVRNLAEPNLVALSGDTASFLAGGEYPIPVPGTFGQVSVEYKRYGVGLAFTPTVLSQGLIGLNTLQQLPWIGDVPVLGALFRSTSYQKNESELAIIVTPRLVRPSRPGDVIKTPLDATLPANDADLFLLGKPEVTPAMARLVAKVPPREFVGHVLDLPKGVQNVAN